MNKLFFIVIAAVFIFVSCDTTGTYVKNETNKTGMGNNEDIFATDDEKSADSNDATGTNEEMQKPIRLDSKTVAMIGSYKLTKDKYDIIVKYMQERHDYKLTEDQEGEFIEYIVNKKLMALEARKLGYAEQRELQYKYEWDFDDIISHAFYNDEIEKKSKVRASDAKKYYDKNKGDFIEIKAQHILLKNKGLANNLHRRLLKGENFEELARKYSEDKTTKGAGGNLGFFTKGVMVEEFENAVYSLSKEELSAPVKSIYGYHIIKLNEKRKISFDDSKDKIIKMIRSKRKKDVFDKVINKLKKKYRVTINEDILK